MKKICIISAFMAVLLTLASCGGPVMGGEDGTFSITINGGGGGRAVLDWDPSTEISDLVHTITLSGGPGSAIPPREGIKAGQTVQFSVTPGHWNIAVRAYLGAELKAECFIEVDLLPGPNGVIPIKMGPPSGETPINQTPTAGDYDISGTGEFTYNGNAKTVTVTAKEGKSAGAVKIYYEGKNGTTYTKSETPPTNAGTYDVTFYVAAADGWNAASGISAGTLTINKAVGADVGEPSLKEKTHNSITIFKVDPPSGQSVEYAISETDVELVWLEGSAEDDFITFNGLKAGTTYNIFARAKANDNYTTGDANDSLKVTTPQIVFVNFALIDEHGDPIIVGASVKAGVPLTITAQYPDEGYAVVGWYLNGKKISNDGNEYVFSSPVTGKHTVGLVVTKDGNLYNTEITITVREGE